MTHYSSTATAVLPGTLSQGCPSHDSQHRRPLIHILDDYSLLNIFSFSRPEILVESEVDSLLTESGDSGESGGEWNGERWWYRLVQVCRRWRYIVLGSASRLRLSLVCARGTPVADMLAHSASLPLIIDHFFNNYEITPEDEEGITLALQHRDRVRRIRLKGTAPILQKLISFLDGQFPILEYLLVEPRWSFNGNWKFLETFRAPHLCHLFLTSADISIESPLLTTTSLVTLLLDSIPHSAYFNPNTFLQWISLMPQLEILVIYFCPDIETQSLHTPIVTHVTLPNLRWLGFEGDSAYLEEILPCIALPLLEKLQVYFFNWSATHSIPHLRQFMSTAKNLWPSTITLAFHTHCVEVTTYPHEGAMYTFSLSLDTHNIDRQVASALQILQTLRVAFSTVEHLTLRHDGRTLSSPSRIAPQADPAQWRELLRFFVNVKTLFVESRLVGQLSRALQSGTGESPMELLPELQELWCPAMPTSVNAFTPFIDAREKAGHPVTMIHI